MGKRSSGFERVKSDFYPTPFAAVPPLIPHLRTARIRRFAEPCAGDGALVEHLQSFKLSCVYAGDIATGQDALARKSYGAIDCICTNPPYERRLMHALISHFETIAPTWLLLELDWSATRQAEPLLPTCSDIVVVGRLKLFAGTACAGKQNFAWFRFDHQHRGGPVLHPRTVERTRVTRSCAGCGTPYRPLRADAKFCSGGCRQRAYRERLSVT
jgi:hypothetical protein